MHSTIFYRVDTFFYKEKLGYWSPAGSGPGGKTLEEAHQRVRENIASMNESNPKVLKNVKIQINKIVTTTEAIEEITGSDMTFFMLKTVDQN